MVRSQRRHHSSQSASHPPATAASGEWKNHEFSGKPFEFLKSDFLSPKKKATL